MSIAGPLRRILSPLGQASAGGLVRAGLVALYNPTKVNLIKRSEALDDAAWTKAGCTITADATTDPWGGSVADKLMEDTSVGSHNVSQLYTYQNIAYTVSFYVKAAERTWVYFQTNPTGTIRRAWFNIGTGTLGTVNTELSNASITSVGSGWYRCAVTFTPNAGGQSGFWAVTTADAATGYTGDATKGIYITGVQLNEGSSASAYEASSQTLPDLVGSANGTLGTTSAAEATDPRWESNALGFDGSDDLVTITGGAQQVLAYDIAFSLTNAITAASASRGLIEFDFQGATGDLLLWGSATGQFTNEILTAIMKNGVGAKQAYTDAVASIGVGWHLLQGRWNSGTTQYDWWLDNVALTISKVATPAIQTFGACRIGKGYAGTTHNGRLGYLTIYNRAYTDSERGRNYNAIKAACAAKGITLP